MRCGGGINHRIGLFDAISSRRITSRPRARSPQPCAPGAQLNDKAMLEVEVETLEELQQALDAKVDRIMLDKFSLDDMRRAVSLRGTSEPGITLEASGSMTLERLRESRRQASISFRSAD